MLCASVLMQWNQVADFNKHLFDLHLDPYMVRVSNKVFGLWLPRSTSGARLKCSTVRCRFNAVNFIKKYLQKTLHSSPVRARYGVSIDPTSNWHTASVSVIIYVISYYFGPRYNGTRLYLIHEHHHPYTERLSNKVFRLSASRSLVRDILFISCSSARSLHASF